MKALKIFVIAGEASGDLLASKIIHELKNISEVEIIVEGVGGDLLQKQGQKSIFPMSDISVMGFLEVVPRLFLILRRIKETAKAIMQTKPDIVLTIDSPDFCFRVIKKLARKKIEKTKIVHYVAPTVWAYREKRAKKIAKLYDLLLVILPFEPAYFTKYGLKTVFIGHPIFSKHNQDLLELRKFDPNNKKYLLVTVGSRVSEARLLLPIFCEVIKRLSKDFPEMEFIFPTTTHLKDFLSNELSHRIKKYKIVTDIKDKEEAMLIADYALAKSGTNTMENAFYNICQVICYKVNFLTYKIAKALVKIKFINLLNINANRAVIPELVQDQCEADEIYKEISNLLNNKNKAIQQITEVQQMLSKFSNDQDINPSKYAAEEIKKLTAE